LQSISYNIIHLTLKILSYKQKMNILGNMNPKEFSDSETEFWVDLDKDLSTHFASFSPETKSNLPPDFSAQEQDFLKNAPNIYYRERLQKLVSQVRIASQCELQNKVAKTIEALQIEQKKRIHEINALHVDQIKSLKNEFMALEDVLKLKDKEIASLQQKIVEQELIVVSSRFGNKKNLDNERIVAELKSNLDIAKLGFNMQIDHMRELVEIYRKDQEKAENELKTVQEELKTKVMNYEEMLEKGRKEIQNSKNEAEEKVRMIQEKYDAFRSDTEKELKVRYAIHKRQVDLIAFLKNELKNAKTVIETPRLNAIYLNKIGKRGFSLAPQIEEMQAAQVKNFKSKGLYKKNIAINSSFSTSASPLYSNPSDLDLILSSKLSLVPESKHN
jgi:hypothetical protein